MGTGAEDFGRERILERAGELAIDLCAVGGPDGFQGLTVNQ
jgi:hypothetical protein